MLSCLFFNDTATTEIYTLSLHDALPILSIVIAVSKKCRLSNTIFSRQTASMRSFVRWSCFNYTRDWPGNESKEKHYQMMPLRSEEHTSELQSRQYLVCRLLLEKKNNDIR